MFQRSRSPVFSGAAFDGPYPLTVLSVVPRGAGVYVVLDGSDFRPRVLDVGESHDLYARLMTHDRKPCWHRHALATVQVAVRPMPGSTKHERVHLERRIRDEYSPPCGEF